jgi:hypothetical protein
MPPSNFDICTDGASVSMSFLRNQPCYRISISICEQKEMAGRLSSARLRRVTLQADVSLQLRAAR